MFVGIDPGWKNLGLAVITDSGELTTKVFNPSASRTLYEAVGEVFSHIPYQGSTYLCIERYVAYNGVHNADSEFILMMIGALTYQAESLGWKVIPVRAIDWKPRLCKTMFKQEGFRNPSRSFDKVYSLAMAKFLFPEFRGTDHEADAVCLAYSSGYHTHKTVVAVNDAVKKREGVGSGLVVGRDVDIA